MIESCTSNIAYPSECPKVLYTRVIVCKAVLVPQPAENSLNDVTPLSRRFAICFQYLIPILQKTQIFIDGNKRASVIFANHYLISHGQGFLVIPEEHVPEFKRKLVDFYEGENIEIISDFIIA